MTDDPGRLEWVVSGDEAGERVDRGIAGRYREISRSYAATLVDNGAVFVNGAAVHKQGYKLKAGDVVALEMPAPQPSPLTPEEIPLNIVYEDADLLVVDKPAGMVVHPAPGHAGGTLVNAIL